MTKKTTKRSRAKSGAGKAAPKVTSKDFNKAAVEAGWTKDPEEIARRQAEAAKAEPKPEPKTKRPAPKAKAAPKAVKEKKAKPISSVATIRRLMAEDPSCTAEQISAELDRLGLSKGLVTVQTIRSDFLGTYRALSAAGALKRPIALN